MDGWDNMLEVTIEKRLRHFHLQADFTMKDEIVVLTGKSGSGKTTLLNCIAGIAFPDRGFIRLNGHVLFSENDSVPIQQRHIGYVFQNYALFPHMTVMENIEYGMKDEELVGKLMKELEIEHLTNAYPQQISGGEKQRVALVRALATKPKLLLLDEPFAALDDETKEKSHEQLIRLHRKWKIPVILVTHSMSEAEKLGDVIYKMESGNLLKT